MATDSIELQEVAYKSIRINVLLGMAYATVILCLVATVAYSGLDDYAKSIITLILGRFLGYIDQVYSFEFGTTRASKTKDETIATLTTAASPVVPSTTTVTTEVTKP